MTTDEAIAAIERCKFPVTEERLIEGRVVESKREVVHCFLGGLGADWDAENAIVLARAAAEATWVQTMLGRCLGLLVENRTYIFDTVVPE